MISFVVGLKVYICSMPRVSMVLQCVFLSVCIDQRDRGNYFKLTKKRSIHFSIPEWVDSDCD